MHKLLNMLNNSTLTLIASLPANDYKLAEAAWANGADAVKIHINVEHRASGTVFGRFDDERENIQKILDVARGRPVGIVLGASPEDAERDFEDVVKAGFDFISIYAHHAAPALLDPRVTRMFAADYSYSADEKKYLASYADVFEASLAAPERYGDRLSLRDLISYKALCDAIDPPVVVPTQKNILPSEVAHLHKAGVSAVMIGAIVAGKTVESYGRATAAFRNAIDRN